MRRDVPRRVFRGPDLPSVAARARVELGDDVLILRTRTLRPGLIEIVAADAREVARFERRLAAPAPAPRAADAAPRPHVVALVGPTGAGKTTTAVKLAVHQDAFPSLRSGQAPRLRFGFITLDTFRAGAIAQLEAFAAVARIPLEVVYDRRDVAGALARLAHCDVVIVDTPGRGPKDAASDAEWRALLAELAPDEVHLVLPATVRHDVAAGVRDALVDDDAMPADPAAAEAPRAGHVPTHLLLTKLDEVPGETGIADLASLVQLPTRWVCDGQEIPTDLAPAVPRILRALGASVPEAA